MDTSRQDSVIQKLGTSCTTDVQEMHKIPPYTISYRDANYLSQRKPEIAEVNDETHVSNLNVSVQVLLMTCKVKATTTNGSSTIARALIDPGSSALFILA